MRHDIMVSSASLDFQKISAHDEEQPFLHPLNARFDLQVPSSISGGPAVLRQSTDIDPGL